MARIRGADGRFEKTPVSSQPGENETRAGLVPGLGLAPRAAECRAYLRERVAEALPTIVEALVKQAEKGSISHAKGLIALSGLDRERDAPARPEDSGLVELLDGWARE